MYFRDIGQKFYYYLKEKEKENFKYENPEDYFFNYLLPLLYDNNGVYLISSGSNTFEEQEIKTKNKFDYENIKKKYYDYFRNSEKKFELPEFIDGNTLKHNTTSFCISLHNNEILENNDIVFSYLGLCLSIKIQSGFLITFNDNEINYIIYKGFEECRKYMSSEIYSNTIQRELNSFNGYYLNNEIQKGIHKRVNFNPFSEYLIEVKIGEKIKKKLEEINYIKLLYNLSKNKIGRFGGDKDFFIYCNKYYHMGDKIYVGFLFKNNQFTSYLLNFMKNNIAGYDFYFDNIDIINKLFGDNLNFVLKTGQFGFYALKPQKFHQFFDMKKNFKDKKILNYYKLYLMAILNDETIDDATKNIAQFLKEIEKKKQKKIYGKQVVKDFFEIKNYRNSIKILNEMMELNYQIEKIENIKDLLEKKKDQIKYVIQLIKYYYNLEKNEN